MMARNILPDAFLARMKTQLGSDFAAFMATYDHSPSVGLRVNTLKLSPEQFATIAPEPLDPIPWVPAGFSVPPHSRLGKHPYYAAGLYYLQDPAAQAVAALLDPQPGETVLDLAAAPGGKTTHIASLMQGRGLLVANDIKPNRARDLARNVERWGASNVVITNESTPRMAAHFGAYFDRVLVDAPCSAEAVFRKEPGDRSKWQPKLVNSCATQQDAIMLDAALLVRPGGVLVYATCTFAPTEDEGTLARFLDAHPDFELVSPPRFAGFDVGRPDWLDNDNPSFALERAVRLWPHKAPGEGHFIAILRRSSKAPEQPSILDLLRPAPIPEAAARDFASFCAQTLDWQPPQARLALIGSYLYLLPDALPDLKGLRLVHWGWWLGTAKKNRFEPSHSFAMGLRAQDVIRQIPLSMHDPDLRRYLRGEVLTSAGPDGWVLVTVDGYPLGWAKRVQGRLKSNLPSWLRQL
jgi:16S rRNA C967 or C1407 C5-methylase (RsmB/RsmF family)/NOL1/NOP2/fmu family ribosome biogenesis protein